MHGTVWRSTLTVKEILWLGLKPYAVEFAYHDVELAEVAIITQEPKDCMRLLTDVFLHVIILGSSNISHRIIDWISG